MNIISKSILKGLLCSSLLLISCNEDDTSDIKNNDVVVAKASVTEASIASSTPKRGTEYNFSYNVNTPVKIEVVNYNENYAYEIKLTGIYLKKEYIVSLSKQAEVIDNEGDNDKGGIKEKLAEVSPGKDIDTPITTPKTTLVADVENLQMEADAYTAVFVEKESNAELALGGADANYTILDIDSPYFLTTTQIESDGWAKLTTLDLSVSTFRVRPANNLAPVGYLSGVGVQLAIYDTDLKYIGKINSSGSNGTVTNGTYSYKFRGSDLNNLIQTNGEYLLRLDESIPTTPVADKIYKKGVFQKIQINKATNAIEVVKDKVLAEKFIQEKSLKKQ